MRILLLLLAACAPHATLPPDTAHKPGAAVHLSSAEVVDAGAHVLQITADAPLAGLQVSVSDGREELSNLHAGPVAAGEQVLVPLTLREQAADRLLGVFVQTASGGRAFAVRVRGTDGGTPAQAVRHDPLGRKIAPIVAAP